MSVRAELCARPDEPTMNPLSVVMITGTPAAAAAAEVSALNRNATRSFATSVHEVVMILLLLRACVITNFEVPLRIAVVGFGVAHVELFSARS